MKIEKNEQKLKRWLRAEERKIARMNIPNNKLKEVLKKISEHLYLIKESKRRFNSESYKANFNNNWKGNSSNWNGNFNGLANPTPLTLVTNNGRYLGHVWVNGVKVLKRPTGHFQGIQKTINLNQNLLNPKNPPLNRTRVTPHLMKAVENHLRNLGYRSMSTHFPMGKMFNMLRQSPNWKETGPMVYKKNIR
jgi:hypothetical protein